MAKTNRQKYQFQFLKHGNWSLILKKKKELKSAKVRVTMQFYNKSIELRSNGRWHWILSVVNLVLYKQQVSG